MKDENDKVWFFYASSIQSRGMSSENAFEFVMPTAKQPIDRTEEGLEQSPGHRDKLMDELDTHQENTKDKNGDMNSNITRMYDIMDAHYSGLKQNVGIKEN